MTPFDDRASTLGEGPLWHPLRQQLFWFDILEQKVLSRAGDQTLEWAFDEPVSAAGWVDEDTLLIASASGLWRFRISTGAQVLLAELEADRPDTRSNDGRADPWGGFWISTMGRNQEPGIGAIYRFIKGDVHLLISDVTIPNAISFAPDRSYACYADTAKQKVMRLPLDDAGWPADEAEVYLDLTGEKLNPDGAVFDADGLLWLALWGAGEVRAYAADGSLKHQVPVPAAQATCPAFGGEDLGTLYVTSARKGLPAEELKHTPAHGLTFARAGLAVGLSEPMVVL